MFCFKKAKKDWSQKNCFMVRRDGLVNKVLARQVPGPS